MIWLFHLQIKNHALLLWRRLTMSKNHMIEEGTKHARNTETDYTTCSDLERFQDFIYRHLRIQNIIRCAHSPINLVVYLKQLNYKKKKKCKKRNFLNYWKMQTTMMITMKIFLHSYLSRCSPASHSVKWLITFLNKFTKIKN